MIYRIKTLWLRRTVLVPVIVGFVVYLLAEFTWECCKEICKGIREVCKDVAPIIAECVRDICTVWRGPSA